MSLPLGPRSRAQGQTVFDLRLCRLSPAPRLDMNRLPSELGEAKQGSCDSTELQYESPWEVLLNTFDS